MTKKRIAVIGGGVSGLSSIKCCLEEGLEPVCFERTDDIGGLWRFQENPEEGRASIYKSVIINTSKEMMCFSDYPIPDHYPNFMHNSQVLEYFRMYAKEFDLLKYIRFKTTVCSVKKQPDFSTSGQWEVVTESEGKKEVNVFDGVMVCTGHHTNAHLPLESFPGIEKFKGQYFHSRDYKNPDIFTGKRVIIIGIGNSGGDLAVEISHTAKQVFLSTRRGAWILNRVADYGYPFDVLFSSRYKHFLSKICGQSLVNSFLEKKMNQRFDHKMFGLKPKHRYVATMGVGQYVESQRHTIQGDYIDTMEELADLVGVRPNLLSLAFTDPKLAVQLFWGPCTPIQYRLQGPGKWNGARKAILTTEDRIRKPMMTRVIESSNSMTSTITMARFMLAVIFFAILMTYF
ncbi:dimethylaniline monooxygenase [N-oxide-forming] 5 [Leptonychotes weddellii]|uniref:Flavin-containing monooxygenase n=1 Tax=Leptonychotes weddellii TaxID=9713 RepID=A0A7F8QI92_LEPWE|nr:dimethylaniline monooxygenase [N-oxide-forming] 5 [Leptonychotes weddellii]